MPTCLLSLSSTGLETRLTGHAGVARRECVAFYTVLRQDSRTWRSAWRVVAVYGIVVTFLPRDMQMCSYKQNENIKRQGLCEQCVQSKKRIRQEMEVTDICKRFILSQILIKNDVCISTFTSLEEVYLEKGHVMPSKENTNISKYLILEVSISDV